jgi:hypothetical protein
LYQLWAMPPLLPCLGEHDARVAVAGFLRAQARNTAG